MKNVIIIGSFLLCQFLYGCVITKRDVKGIEYFDGNFSFEYRYYSEMFDLFYYNNSCAYDSIAEEPSGTSWTLLNRDVSHLYINDSLMIVAKRSKNFYIYQVNKSGRLKEYYKEKDTLALNSRLKKIGVTYPVILLPIKKK